MDLVTKTNIGIILPEMKGKSQCLLSNSFNPSKI